MKGLDTWKNKGNGYFVIKLHYTADPDKRGVKWKEHAKKGMTEEAWQMEYEMNAEVQRGKRVFPQFIETIHTAELQANPGLVMFRGWDFGFHNPCCVWSQINTEDQWAIHNCILGHDESLEEFVSRAKVLYKGFTFKDYCDIAGSQSTDKKDKTSIQILNAHSIYPLCRKTSPEDRAVVIRSKLLIRSDNKPGLIVDRNNCRIIIEGFNGGYHYPETTTRNPKEREQPYKDGFYEHPFDCLGYKAMYIFHYRNPERKIIRFRQKRYNRFTGIPIG
jgi:hypothetical protein